MPSHPPTWGNLPSITVYLDYYGIPHTFCKLDDGLGNADYFGFAPAKPGSLSGPGIVGVGLTTHVLGDTGNSKAGYIDDACWSKTIAISAGQYRAIDSTIKEWQAAPPVYLFSGNNCTAFVRTLLRAGNAWYGGIHGGANPFNLVPFNEQGPLFTTDVEGIRHFSDRVLDPANTPGTPAYAYLHPQA